MKKHSLFNRAISLVLSLVLVASCLPAGLITAKAATGADGVVPGTTVADGNTLDSWKDTAFNPFDLTTEHAGGVWTDKTVLKSSDVSAAFNISGVDVAQDNFLVVLSALGANSVVAGKSTTPTDTIFVLDVSNSMENGDLSSMVEATNDAINTLLETNEKNRVGVVVYATNVDVLLPLDRYTPVTKTSWYGPSETAYIEMSNDYSQIRTARHRPWNSNTTAYVKNGDGDNVNTSVSASGAAYIQGGLWEAYEMFEGATVSDVRTPVLVLMSDGAPSYGTEDYNDVKTPDVGNGGTNSITDGLAFLTQLTAAYVKEKIGRKYNCSAYFYSVGLGVSEGNTVSIAETVLDTSKTRTDIENNWSRYLALANATSKTMSLSAANENVTITYDAVVDATSKNYTDRYFPANDASQLGSAFAGIVNEINLKASYNVTRIDGNDANTGGYVTFVDEIGAGMEVKEIKGILIGEHLFSGEALAKAMAEGEFGDEENPTGLGYNLVWAIIERLRITDSETETAEEIVWDLVRDAQAAGQIRYSGSDWSNVIGWFGNAEGKFVGFWDVDDSNPVIPAGATHANLCYGMLGTTTSSQTAHASDMMYVAITVSKAITNGKIEATTPQIVTFRVPAALLPTVTYQIEVQAASGEEITENTEATITYNPAEPIRLLYEVGVHSQITALNIDRFLPEGYSHKDADGNYYLYTNAWHQSNDSDALYDTSKNHITYAYFEPSEQNEHYYFTEDTALYVKNGDAYEKLTTAPVTDGSVTYYFRHKVFEATATATGTAVAAQVDIHYGVVSPKLLSNSENLVQNGDGVYYIKKGTMHYETIHNHDKQKQSNVTGSFGYRLHQLVDIAVNGQDLSHHYEIMYMGNNGRVTFAPAQGLKITKKMADGATPDAQFTFEVALAANQTLATAYKTVHVARNGTETEGSANVAGGKLTVSLMPGESVYILGLPAGTEYTVTEKDAEGYLLESSRETVGTIANNTISQAEFVNVVRKAGALTVSKWVTYQDGVNPTADNNEFDVTVTLTEGAENFVGDVTVDGQTQTVTDGKITFKIKHEQQVVIENIPEGVAYQVEETAMPTGYTWKNQGAASLSGTIDADGQVVELTNEYDPEDVTIKVGEDEVLDVTFDKHLDFRYNGGGAYSFSFTLSRYNPATAQWETVGSRSIMFGNPEWNEVSSVINVRFTDNDIVETFCAAGEYFFRMAEVPDTFPGMVYDLTHHDFKITVADEDLDGKLEITKVEAIDAGVSVINGNNAWSVHTEFNNLYSAVDTSISIQASKTLTNTLTNENILKDGQFEFALYQTDDTFDITGKTPVTVKNGANGDIVFPAITYKYSDLTETYTSYYYVLKEHGSDANGVTQDKKVYHIEVNVEKTTVGGEAVAKINWLRYKRANSSNYSLANVANGVFNEITFENSYTPAAVTAEITANKTLTNRTPGKTPTDMQVPADTFGFKLEAVGNAPMPASDTAYAAQGGAIAFGQITFTQAGVYRYKITEKDVNSAYITKDSSEYTAVVTVTDDGLGQLQAEVTYLLGENHVQQAVFHNTYVATPTGDIILGGTKSWDAAVGTDRDMAEGEFAFTLTKPDGSTETVRNTESGGEKFIFSPITFDRVGTYEFTVTEGIPHGAVNNTLHGITYDTNVRKITVTVTDDGSGKLKASVGGYALTEGAGRENYLVQFNNRYAAAADTVRIVAHKDLVGRELNPSDFSFRIEAITSGAPMPVNDVVANNENGDVIFEEMTFRAVGVYQYRITELDKDGGALTDGYTHNGVTYSQKEYTVTVTVKDNALGKLVAHVESVDENGDAQPGGVVFTNVYKAASAKVRLEGDDAATDGKIFTDESSLPENKKTLDDYEFTFVLSKTGGEIVQTVVDNGAGFAFDEIEFDTAGEYEYLIYERPTGQPGVIFDYAKYKVTVTVTDNGQGQLVADVKREKASSGESDDYQTVGGVVFENSYKAEETSLVIEGTKTLQGRKLKDKEFTFLVKDGATGAVLGVAKNDKNGNFRFPEITYNAEGTFTYLLEEKAEDAKGITYDTRQYKIVVTVKDVNGQLQAAATITCDNASAEQVSFVNVYTPEKTPEKDPEKTPEKEPGIDSPKTGDMFHANVWTLMMAVSAMGLLAVLVLGRKKETDE